jgi:hypothetical protein
MSQRKDEQWLDDQLRRAIHGSTPRFDAEAWKQKHPEEYQGLVARRERRAGWRKPHPTIARLAVAAAIVVATGLFVLSRSTHGPDQPPTPPEWATGSPVEMMTMRSLRLAYEQGGFDGLDRQLQSTLDEFGPRSLGVPRWELF